MKQANRSRRWRRKNPAKFRLSLDKSAIKHFLNTANGDQLNWLLQNVRQAVHTRSHTTAELVSLIYKTWPNIDTTVLSGKTSVKLSVQQWLRWHPADVIKRGINVAEALCHQYNGLSPLGVIGYCVTHPITAQKQLNILQKE